MLDFYAKLQTKSNRAAWDRVTAVTGSCARPYKIRSVHTMQRDRVTAPFTIFFRTITGEGGYGCETCGARRHDSFCRMSDVFAVAAHHLNLCRAVVRSRPVEGVAIVDGTKYGVILRDGVMILAMQPAFGSSQIAIRVVAS